MNKILISILVPVYNTSKYLDECIESILNQNIKDIEIICINDGSTDNSLDILNKYAKKDSRIIIIDKDNTGYGNSMNLGLKKAKGEFIGIVESDDFVSREMFEKLYTSAHDQDVDIVKSNYYSYKNEKSKEFTFTEVLEKCKYNIPFNPLENKEIFNVQGCIWSAIYNREFLLKNNIWFNETPGASYQDISFNIKVWSCSKKVLLLKEAYLNYRIDNINSSVKSPEKVFCVCDEFKEVERFLNERKNIKKEILDVVTNLKYKIYLENYHRLASAFQYAFILEMSKELSNDIDLLYKINIKNQDLENLKFISKNPHEYFKNTSKDYFDSRIDLLPILNKEVYLEGFLNKLDDFENIIVYGAGIIGKKVAQNLINNKKQIHCFAISNKSNNENMFMNIDIKLINEIQIKDNSVVVVAVKQKDQFEIINNLQLLGFENIISIDTILLKAMY